MVSRDHCTTGRGGVDHRGDCKLIIERWSRSGVPCSGIDTHKAAAMRRVRIRIYRIQGHPAIWSGRPGDCSMQGSTIANPLISKTDSSLRSRLSIALLLYVADVVGGW